MKRLLFFAVAVAVLPSLPLRADDDVARIRKEIDASDYSAAQRDSELVLAVHPENTQVRALRVLSRTYGMRPATEEAEWMVRTYPNDPWSWYALAVVSGYSGEGDALTDIDKAVALSAAPLRDIVLLRISILSSSQSDQALAYADEQVKAFAGDPYVLAARAQVLQWAKGASADDIQKANDETLAAMPPHDVRIRRMMSDDLVRRKQAERGAALLLEALHEYPLSAGLVARYATAVRAINTLSDSQKDAAIDAVTEPLLRARGNDPDVLLRIAEVYRSSQRAGEADTLEGLIVDRQPWSSAAETLAYERIYREADERHGDTDPEVRKQEERLTREFLARPCHDLPAYVQSAYQSLFLHARRDASVSNDEMRTILRGMVGDGRSPNAQYLAAGIELANRGIDFKEAERLIDLGAAGMEKQLVRLKAVFDEKTVKLSMDNQRARVLDARGWVAFKRGDTATAWRDLEEAHKLSPDDPSLQYHYGRLLEARGDVAGAQREWALGIGGFIPNDVNDSYLALAEKYKASHGGKADGLDAWITKLKPVEDAAVRKTKVLAERTKEPRPAPKFALKTLDGRSVSLEELHGKIAVVNFWGVWCGWCVAEMPDLQKLVAKYAKDPNVRIVTIDNDGDIGIVKKFMAEKKYDFQVLLDDGYVSTSGINSFPTTWFLDPQGRIAFNKRGASDKLEEEFTWRIEALKR
jgi:thiol-disulfide isomerase/thioredoxin